MIALLCVSFGHILNIIPHEGLISSVLSNQKYLLRSAHPVRDSSRHLQVGFASLSFRLSITIFVPKDFQSAGVVMDQVIKPISSSVSMSAGPTVDSISLAASIAVANSSVRGRASRFGRRDGAPPPRLSQKQPPGWPTRTWAEPRER